jgi:adenine-specific DNA-methyltransferase
MSNKKQLQKLELTWIGKGEEPKLEPRILIENPEYSNGDPNSENMLIHGDNLLALKALEQDYAGKVKCIYIDPPYNTGAAFEYYDDNIEHSIWLDLMKRRLTLLKSLLSNDGFICVHIDDSEGDYLKVLMDEVFGRSNYLTTFYIRVRYADKTLKQDMAFHKEIEQVLHLYSEYSLLSEGDCHL